jgi:hypothetical protein
MSKGEAMTINASRKRGSRTSEFQASTAAVVADCKDYHRDFSGARDLRKLGLRTISLFLLELEWQRGVANRR